MHIIDWIIVVIPVIIVIWIGLKSQKYVRSVADFLTAGRVGGRYLLAVAQGESGMGLITAIAVFEVYYNNGFGYSFWSSVLVPVAMFLSLSGFCLYRYRETKAMTMGQYLEMRYNKPLRTTAAVLQSISGILNYAIFPAVGARFLIYFLDLPLQINLLGLHFPTFLLIMCVFLGLALTIALLGGQVTVMATDCIQGLLSYPMFAAIVIYLLYRFSWTNEIMPALVNRPPGESFLDPYDISKLRDFNLFYVVSGMVGLFVGRISHGAETGYNGAARTPHEAKMGGLLGTWRGGFSIMIFILLSIVAITFMKHPDFADGANNVRRYLSQKITSDVLTPQLPPAAVSSLSQELNSIKPSRGSLSLTPCKTHEEYLKTNRDPYLEKVSKTIDEQHGNRKLYQTFRTIYTQQIVPVAIREILPIGLTGIFCTIMIFLLISTDTTYMHAWGSIVIQDFLLPLRKKPFTPKQQITALRLSITGVCLFVLFFSYFFAQIDYIYMFFAITGALWCGGGIIITLGLYWRRGTSAGAFAALFGGAIISGSGIILQLTWAQYVYPFLAANGLVESVGSLFTTLSAPFHPYIEWTMNPDKFPINSKEISFIGIMSTAILYTGVSLLTCRKPFDLERMLHREEKKAKEKCAVKISFRTMRKAVSKFFFEKILGYSDAYTVGDKCLAWSVFLYSFAYQFVILFLGVVVWNGFSRWSAETWGWYFYFKNILVCTGIAVVTTVWFTWGGIRDLIDMFRLLEKEKRNDNDNGRVETPDESGKTPKKIVSLLLPMILMSVFLCSCANHGPENARIAFVPDGAVRLDGIADEVHWKNVPALSLVRPLEHIAPGTPPLARGKYENEKIESGTLRLLYDRVNLYFFAELTDSDVVQFSTDSRHGLFQSGDLFELFLKPDDAPAFWEFHAAPNGLRNTLFYEKRGYPRRLPSKLEPGFQIAVKISGTLNNHSDLDRGWTVEGAIPLELLAKTGVQFKEGKSWRILAGRYNYSFGLPRLQNTAFPELPRVFFHESESYAPIQFECGKGPL